MKDINEKLALLRDKIDNNEKIRIAILGLGSVGNYLLTYLISELNNIDIYILGRNNDKQIKDINISLVACGIRYNKYPNIIFTQTEFSNIDNMSVNLNRINPDFIINTSRVYSHLKYGTISWNSIRAYGLWSPLSVSLIKNIMISIQNAKISPIVINTSYSDASNAWLKTGGFLYPDFGSGNLNHLIPRIKLSIADILRIDDVENIDITLATSHFHDVVISKEGHYEGVMPLIVSSYKGNVIEINYNKVFSNCNISMPTDEKRNMMNASSNFEIIYKILQSIKSRKKIKLHIPGYDGLIGGYPVEIVSNKDNTNVNIFDYYFSQNEMYESNKKSIYLDGIEDIRNGDLIYTDELITKVNKSFNFDLPKKINICECEILANEIIKEIIEKK